MLAHSKRSKRKNVRPGIMGLPREVHAYIISKLDGISLARSQRVCRLWYNVVQDFEQCFQIWLIKCLKEIPLYILVEITGIQEIYNCEESLTYVENLKKLPWMFWREVYAEHQRSSYLKWRQSEKKLDLSFFKGYGMVTALAFIDNMLFSGHEDGRVMCWKNIAIQLEGYMCHQHQRAVTDLAVTTSGQSVNHLLLGINNTFLISASEDSSLIVNDITSQKSTKVAYFSKRVNTVSCSGLTFVAGASGSFLQGHPVWQIDFSKGLSVQTEVQLKLASEESSNIVCASLHRNKVVTGNDLGNLYEHKWTFEGDNVKQEKPVCLTKLSSKPKYLFNKDSNLICLTEDGHLGVSIQSKDFKLHNVYEALQKVPECIAWRGSVLAIGAQTGVVFLYLIRLEDDLQNLDLEQPVKTLKLEADHINSIAIGDDGAGPLIAIATEHSAISVFRWCR